MSDARREILLPSFLRAMNPQFRNQSGPVLCAKEVARELDGCPRFGVETGLGAGRPGRYKAPASTNPPYRAASPNTLVSGRSAPYGPAEVAEDEAVVDVASSAVSATGYAVRSSFITNDRFRREAVRTDPPLATGRGRPRGTAIRRSSSHPRRERSLGSFSHASLGLPGPNPITGET